MQGTQVVGASITNLVIEIGEQAGAVATYDALQPNSTLRRESRIKSIHSSLAIEQNTLTLEQVSDIIDGKRVLGPPQDIREVKNAYEAYERVSLEKSGTADLIRAEDGNLRYEYYIPMNDPETVLLIDAWKDQETIDKHHASPMMQTIASLREKYDLHMTVERYLSDDAGFSAHDSSFIRN